MRGEVSTWRDSPWLACSVMGLVMSVVCATIWGPDKLGKWLWVALLKQGVLAQVNPRGLFPPQPLCSSVGSTINATQQQCHTWAAPVALCSPAGVQGAEATTEGVREGSSIYPLFLPVW